VILTIFQDKKKKLGDVVHGKAREPTQRLMEKPPKRKRRRWNRIGDEKERWKSGKGVASAHELEKAKTERFAPQDGRETQGGKKGSSTIIHHTGKEKAERDRLLKSEQGGGEGGILQKKKSRT